MQDMRQQPRHSTPTPYTPYYGATGGYDNEVFPSHMDHRGESFSSLHTEDTIPASGIHRASS